jgi:hypothetical protein
MSAMLLLGPEYLEYLGVQQEKQLKTGLRINITMPGATCQVIDMANFS